MAGGAAVLTFGGLAFGATKAGARKVVGAQWRGVSDNLKRSEAWGVGEGEAQRLGADVMCVIDSY
eukprot:2793587-Rhodomonas_salina.2